MNNQVDLKSAERRVVRLAFQDGLWEILLGLMILALALAAILRDALGLPWIYLPLIVVFTLGVPAMAYAPYAFLNLLCPVIAIIIASIGWGIVKAGEPGRRRV